MKSKLAIVAVIVVLILGGAYALRKPTAQIKQKSMSSKELYQRPSTIISQKLASTLDPVQGQDAVVREKCKKVWPILEKIPTAETLKEPDLLNLSCFKSTPDLVINDNIYNFCFGKDLKLEENKTACISALTLYRSFVIYQLTKNVTDFASLDSVTLINQIMALFTGAEQYKTTQEFVAKMEPRAEALLSKEKDLFAAYKVVTLARAAKSMTAEEEGVGPEDQKRYANEALNIIEEAEKFDVVDEEMAAARWGIYLRGKDREKAEGLIDSYMQQHPDSARAKYDKSYFLWKDGNTEGAKQLLAEALKLDPKQGLYHDTINKIDDAKDGDKIYNFTMNVKFDEL